MRPDSFRCLVEVIISEPSLREAVESRWNVSWNATLNDGWLMKPPAKDQDDQDDQVNIIS